MLNIAFRPATRADIGPLQAIFMGNSGFNQMNFSSIGQPIISNINLIGTKGGQICGFIQAQRGVGQNSNLLDIHSPVMTFSVLHTLEQEIDKEAEQGQTDDRGALPHPSREDAFSLLKNEFMNAAIEVAIETIQDLEYYRFGHASPQRIKPLQQFLTPSPTSPQEENEKNLKNPVATQHEPVVS
ncbi:MAG: hypothetical protein PHX61_07980 [Alphaproteobacteria bacterium]|nr:hypothetical protein [Alphaproteobacteria bacterium]